MMILVKQANVYAPQHMGVKDVLICNEKIEYIADTISCSEFPCIIIDGTNKRMIPGLIDSHVHITGGGGEGGFHTRTPEIQLSEIIRGGITTVMGLIGTVIAGGKIMMQDYTLQKRGTYEKADIYMDTPS